MENPFSDKPEERTILSGTDTGFIEELSDFLDVLSSPVRLRILTFIGRKPRTIRQISNEIETSYENSKKHMHRLLMLGIVRKELGVSHDSVNEGQPVFYYSLAPGSFDLLQSQLGIFAEMAGIRSNAEIKTKISYVKEQISQSGDLERASLTITGGPDDGRLISLISGMYRLGREETGYQPGDESAMITFSDQYRAVSRISRPHAWLFMKKNTWYIKNGVSQGGTYVNTKKITSEPEELKEGDLVTLSHGPMSVRMIYQGINTKKE